MNDNMLLYRRNIFSQNGEDGVLKELFERIGPGSQICCEFGAWDGIHLSNCRHLILSGWRGVMIEGDAGRFAQLSATYAGNPLVMPVRRYVDDSANSLDLILASLAVPAVDFVSIDVDGLDFDILASLQLRPRVICVEVNAGHHPRDCALLPSSIAKRNVGQPLGAFVALAKALGYGLVAYTGNAILVRNDCLSSYGLKGLCSEDAYQLFLHTITPKEREWLYLVNLGLVPPYHRFGNQLLTAEDLAIPSLRVAAIRMAAAGRAFVSSLRREPQ